MQGAEAQAASQTLEFFNLLPCVQCVSPKQLLADTQHSGTVIMIL